MWNDLKEIRKQGMLSHRNTLIMRRIEITQLVCECINQNSFSDG